MSRHHLERRVGEQWQAFLNIAELFQSLRIHIAGDQLSEKEKGLNISAIISEKEGLQQQVAHLQRMTREDRQAQWEVREELRKAVKDRNDLQEQLLDAIRARDDLHSRFTQDLNIKEQKLADLQKSLT